MRSTKRISAMSPDHKLRETSKAETPDRERNVYSSAALAPVSNDSPCPSPRVKREGDENSGASPNTSVKLESQAQMRYSVHRVSKRKRSPEKYQESPSPVKPKRSRPQRKVATRSRRGAPSDTQQHKNDDLRMLNHILTCILSKLPPKSLMAASLTCKRWQALAQTVWKHATGITVRFTLLRKQCLIYFCIKRQERGKKRLLWAHTQAIASFPTLLLFALVVDMSRSDNTGLQAGLALCEEHIKSEPEPADTLHQHSKG